MTNFFRTISIFFRNPYINPYMAIIRHSAWQLRKILNLFPYEVQMNEIKVHVPNRSIARGSAALANAMGYYDPNNMYFIQEIFERGLYHNFFDIGSNMGFYSLIAARQAETVKVYAFEPHPYTFSLLRDNIRINKNEEKVFCYQYALGDQNGSVIFRDIPGHPENRVIDTPTKEYNTIEVISYRGEDFCHQKGILPQVIKIDVEGYENHVLEGFSSLLNDIQLIFIECWELETTIKLLCQGAGFLGPYKVDYKNRTLKVENINYEDWVFVNPLAVSKLSRVITLN